MQYVRKNVPLISKELMSVDDIEAFIDRTEYSIIGWFSFANCFLSFLLVMGLLNILYSRLSQCVLQLLKFWYFFTVLLPTS